LYFALTIASLPLCSLSLRSLVAATIIGAVALILLDVPLVLLGAAEDLLHTAVGIESRHPFTIWMDILNQGGRAALGIAAAIAVVLVASTNPAPQTGNIVMS
jgi:hypothetical protein